MCASPRPRSCNACERALPSSSAGASVSRTGVILAAGVPRDEPIRVLRVIARLNVGGPALHVSYLTKGLDPLGYETTLVAGKVGPDEGSMEYVVREQGIEPRFVPELQRDISVLHDAIAVAK